MKISVFIILGMILLLPASATSAPFGPGNTGNLPGNGLGMGAGSGGSVPPVINVPPNITIPPDIPVPPNLNVPPVVNLPPNIALPPNVNIPNIITITLPDGRTIEIRR